MRRPMKVIDPPQGPPTLKQRLGMFVFPRLPITRFLFDILRDEFAALIVRSKNAWLPWRRSRLRRVRAMRNVYVNVACGPQVLPGFVSLDLRHQDPAVVAWDSRRSLPVGDGGVRVIRARAWPAAMSRRFGIGDLGLRAYRGLKRAATDLLTTEKFDAVFITIYPAYPALLGPGLKRRFGVAFVLDYQDPWVGEWGRSVGPAAEGRPNLKSRVSRWLASRLEPIALSAADGVTAVSHATYEQALARTPAAAPRASAC